jgi:RNA polymerase sigma factor (sigma-70 family)
VTPLRSSLRSTAIKPLAQFAEADGVPDNGALAETAFRRHQPALVAFLGRRLDGDHATAAEIAQETYLRLLASRRPLEGGDLKALLFRIARNLLVDGARRENTRRHTERTLIVRDADSGPPQPERIVADREALAATLQAIRDLPPRCQEVFVLHRFEGMSYAQIAAQCGISASMVEKHMEKAMRRLVQGAPEASR